MTDEHDNLMEIFDEIMNIDGMWDLITFKRSGPKVTISGVDQYGSKFTWSEELA